MFGIGNPSFIKKDEMVEEVSKWLVPSKSLHNSPRVIIEKESEIDVLNDSKESLDINEYIDNFRIRLDGPESGQNIELQVCDNLLQLADK